MVFVLAGSYSEALHHMLEQPAMNWKYIDDRERLLSMRHGANVVRVGRWHSRPDADQIMEILLAKRAVIEDA